MSIKSTVDIQGKDSEFVENILKEATIDVWAADPVHKALQQKLLQTSDIIIKSKTGIHPLSIKSEHSLAISY